MSAAKSGVAQITPALAAAERGPRWSEMDGVARSAVISALIAEGYSAARIGDAVGTSRNAILGHSHRNGLSGDGYGKMRPKTERSAAGGHATRKKAGVTLAGVAGPGGPAAVGSRQSAVGSDEVAAPEAGEPRPFVGAVLADAGTPAPLPASGPIGFLALTDARCKRPLWPDGPPPRIDAMLFCGALSEPGSSWCKPCAGRLLAGAPQPERRAWRGG